MVDILKGFVIAGFLLAFCGFASAGSPPQIAGYSVAGNPNVEAETVTGDCTFSRTGTNAYSINCPVNGIPLALFGLSDLLTGTGVSFIPNIGDIPVINSGTSNAAITNLPDTVVGSVLKSQGVNTLPAYGTIPTWLSGGANATVDTVNPNVWPASGVGTPVATTSEGTVQTTVSPVSTVIFHIHDLYCNLVNTAGALTNAGGTNYVIALRQNGATTLLACTIGTVVNHCFDTAHTVTLAQGDRIDFIDTPTGAVTALIPKCSALLF